MSKRTWVENGYYNDGTEYIIFRNSNGAYEVEEQLWRDEYELVFTGTYAECKAFTKKRWIEVAESLIG